MRIAIVGAGIHGLTLAWALTRAGHAVTLIDRGAIPNPRNASFDQHRLIHDHAGIVSDAFAAWDLLGRDIGSHLVTTGALRVHAAAMQAGKAHDDLTAAGVACTRLDADALRRMLSGFCLIAEHGVLTTRGGVLLADRIAASLATWLAAHGAILRAQTPVAAIDIMRATITLDGRDTLHPDRLVIAVGAATAQVIPDLASRVSARRQIVVYLKPPPVRRQAWRRMPVFIGLGADDEHWGAPPVADTDLKFAVGSLSRQIGRCESDSRAVTDTETNALIERYRSVIPEIDDYDILRVKACIYATSTSDGLFVEPVDENHRVWVIGGGDGGDYKRAPATALSLAARLTSACARS